MIISKVPASLFLIFLLFLASSCYRMRSSNGGGEIKNFTGRNIDPTDIALPQGYKIEAVAKGFTFPSAITFDEAGKLYIVEAGYSYGEEWTEPKLLRIEDDGKRTEIAKGGKENGPWNGVAYYKGSFYISEGGELNGGKILKVGMDGSITPLVENLPSYGDHHTNGPVILDDYLYFAQGTATNSSVVGNENAEFGWLKRKPDFHDVPCKDITLTGLNFETENVLTSEKDKVSTGAYLPYGSPSKPNQVIKGSLPCSGAILRIQLTGGNLELVAWGLRNPFGMAISSNKKLFITENSFDERGSRPVWGAGDVLWEIKEGTWYGWPDFAAGKLIVNDEEFKSPKGKKLKPVLASYPNDPPKPTAIFAVHSSACSPDFSKSNGFGYVGEAFVPEFGDMAPAVGKSMRPVGFKVSKVNVETGAIDDFIVNKGKRNGPGSWLKNGGLERPVAVKFNNEGNALYIVDFGVMTIDKKSSKPIKETGVIWKVTKQ